MDGAIDLRLIITLGGILFSVAGAAAVGKMQIKILQETLQDIEVRIRKIDQRIDGLENQQAVLKQRMGVLSSMLDPANMERRAREAERLRVEVDHLKQFRDSK